MPRLVQKLCGHPQARFAESALGRFVPLTDDSVYEAARCTSGRFDEPHRSMGKAWAMAALGRPRLGASGYMCEIIPPRGGESGPSSALRRSPISVRQTMWRSSRCMASTQIRSVAGQSEPMPVISSVRWATASRSTPDATSSKWKLSARRPRMRNFGFFYPCSMPTICKEQETDVWANTSDPNVIVGPGTP